MYVRGPSTGRGWGGQSRRASGTVCACVAAITSRRWRHTHVPPGAGPPPAVAGECGRVARAARCVIVSLRSRRADGGTRMRRPLSRGMRHQLSLDSISTCKPGLLRRQPPQEQHGGGGGDGDAAAPGPNWFEFAPLCMSCVWVCTMFDQSLLSLH